MSRYIQFACAFIVLIAVAVPARVEASTILFSDRAAFNLVAQPGEPLAITDTGGYAGRIDVTYGDLLPVIYDGVGTNPDCSPFPFSLGCTSIGFGGGSFGANYTSVSAFLLPVNAVGYEVLGTFTLFGQVVHAATPQFFGFVFDAPTSLLPLPQFAYYPDSLGGFLPHQESFYIQNVVVSTVPEPSTVLLLGSACAFCLAGRKRRTGVAAPKNA